MPKKSSKSRTPTRPASITRHERLSSRRRSTGKGGSKGGSSKKAESRARKVKSAAGRIENPTHSQRAGKVGSNLLTALGGPESVISILEDSSHPKAQALIDRLRSTAHADENFATSYSSVGLKAVDVLEIFKDVQQARIFINAIQEGDEVMRSLIRAAKDQIEPHEKCGSTGKVLDKKTGDPTDEDCKPCRGSGWMLKSGSRESQQLYFELLDWKKQGGLVNIDARRQSAVVVNQNGQQQFVSGEAPMVQQIVKRADQVLLPAVSATSEANSSNLMPEEVMEGETV